MNSSLWNRWFSGRSENSRHEQLRQFQPRLERMEDRNLLAAIGAVSDAPKRSDVPALVARAEAGKTASGAKAADTAGPAAKSAATLTEAKCAAAKSEQPSGEAPAHPRGDKSGAKSGSEIAGGIKTGAAGGESKIGGAAAKDRTAKGLQPIDASATDAAKDSGGKLNPIVAGSKQSAKESRSADPATKDAKLAPTGGQSSAKTAATLSVKSSKSEIGAADRLVTAAATDAALLDVLVALQLPAVQQQR